MTRALIDKIGNMEPSLGVYPDRPGPIVRNTPDRRELVNVRWSMPSSQKALLEAASKRADKLRAKGKDVNFNLLRKMEPDGGTTNIRNTSCKYWTRWLGVENRCVVPVTRFAEPDHGSKVEGDRTPNAWLAHDESQPLVFFAGICVKDWTSVRKVKEGLITADYYGFLTTEPNAIVGPIHPKAMPVILTTGDQVEPWLTAPGRSQGSAATATGQPADHAGQVMSRGVIALTVALLTAILTVADLAVTLLQAFE